MVWCNGMVVTAPSDYTCFSLTASAIAVLPNTISKIRALSSASSILKLRAGSAWCDVVPPPPGYLM